MKSLIEQLQQGEIVVNNDGTLEELRRVLKVAFPEDTYNVMGTHLYYSALSDKGILWTGITHTSLLSRSVKEFIKELDNQTTNNVEPMKVITRTITPEQAQEMIDVACKDWKKELAAEWGAMIVLKTDIKIPEEFYQKIRKACTPPQHELCDRIFGKDEPIYKAGDWVIGWHNKNYNNYKDGAWQIGKVSNGMYVYPINSNTINTGIDDIRFATPEEIKRATMPPDGTPCLVRDANDEGWQLRYANGDGRFYIHSKKSGMTNNWKQFIKLDMNNLPAD